MAFVVQVSDRFLKNFAKLHPNEQLSIKNAVEKDDNGDDIVLLRNCGHHDRTLSNP